MSFYKNIENCLKTNLINLNFLRRKPCATSSISNTVEIQPNFTTMSSELEVFLTYSDSFRFWTLQL